MLATLTAALLLSAPAPADPPEADKPDKDDPPAKVELFAKEDWYKDQKGKEEEFVGVLSKLPDPPKGVVGFGRVNPYRLTLGGDAKPAVREVYVGGKPDLLAPYVGKRVKLTGKAVDMEVEGQDHHEIWPARLELLAPADKSKDGDKPEAGKEPPAKADILADNKLYKMEPGPEKEFVGVLEKGEKGGFQLVMKQGDTTAKESLILYDNRTEPLEPYAGKTVKVTGKQVMGAVGFRTFSHILPGKLEVLPADKEEKKPDDKKEGKELKVLAKGVWRPAGNGNAATQMAIRTGEQLALADGAPPDKAKNEDVQQEAAAKVAKVFKVEAIDWKTQMIVVVSAGPKPTGGYSVEITGLTVKDDALTVHWKLNSPKPGDFVTQAFTHPALAVLAERYDGKTIAFDPPVPKDDK